MSCLICTVAEGVEDWPQFLGPSRDGVFRGGALAKSWPKEGPPALWRKKIGQGFSGPVVAGEKLILFHRVGGEEVVECVKAKSGESEWRFAYPTGYKDDFGFDEGPRATPAIVGGRVYTFGADGELNCLDLQSGKKVWSQSMRERFGAPKGFFGMACSPLVDGSSVYLNIGGAEGAGMVALDCETGELRWKSGKDEASYSSPAAAVLEGTPAIVFLTRMGVVGVDPRNGTERWRMDWRARMAASVNAATPLIWGDSIFVSASYDTGAGVLDVAGGKLRKKWTSDDALSNHYSTSVRVGGSLFGFHGRQESGQSFRCVDWKTGTVKWSHEPVSAGTVTAAGDILLLMLEDGRLLMAGVSEERFDRRAEAQLLGFGVRAYPALAGGLFYARSKDTLGCFDLRAAGQ